MRPTRAFGGDDRGRRGGVRGPDAGDDAAELLWRDLAGLVEGVTTAVKRGDRLVVCGAGCGGPMTPGGEEVSPLNIPAWRSFPLRARLAELTGLPTFVDNDAKALALGEGWVGAAPAVRTTSAWSCRRGSAAASCSTDGCSTGGSATRAMSGT